MTTDEFNTRYTLLKQIAHGTSRSFTAQERASGRAVLAHFFTEDGTPPGSAVAGLVERLAPSDRSKVLEILAVNLSTVVVTQVLEDFRGFERWLQGRSGNPSPPDPVPPPQRPSPAGEFTRLFEQPAGPSPAQPVPMPAQHVPMPAQHVPRPAPAAGPQGSFTELFKSPSEGRTPPRPGSTPGAPPVEILSVRLPLGERPPPRPPAPEPSWPASFDPPKPAPLQSPFLQSPVLQRPALQSPMLQGPILGGPESPPRPVLPGAPRLPPPGEAIVKAPPREVLPPPSPLPGWGGESDYTRQLRGISTPADPIPPVTPPVPAPEVPAGQSRSLVPLLLVLNIVVIIATGLIVYFALKRH